MPTLPGRFTVSHLWQGSPKDTRPQLAGSSMSLFLHNLTLWAQSLGSCVWDYGKLIFAFPGTALSHSDRRHNDGCKDKDVMKIAHCWLFCCPYFNGQEVGSGYRSPDTMDDKGPEPPSMADPSLWWWELQQAVARATVPRKVAEISWGPCLLEKPVFSWRDVPTMPWNWSTCVRQSFSEQETCSDKVHL